MPKTMVFIDSRVNDLDLLVSQFEAGTEYNVLDATHDGLLQIEESFMGKSDYTSIQIISHGSPGAISIGSTNLTESNLFSYQSQLESIGHALTDNGDLLLYGCNVGAGATGQQFVETLAQLTGADVAASDDVTGGVVAGGDWKLEVTSGSIESVIPAVDPALQQYDHTLGLVDDYILAKMSLVAYYDDPSNPKEKEPSKQLAINAWEELKADGWKILENKNGQWVLTPSPTHSTYQDASWGVFNSGFSATVFVKNNNIVIAYRGTNAANDFMGADEALAFIGPSWDQQFTYAVEVADIISKANPNADIQVTGHSLGGGLAQVVSKMFGWSGATFDPGGSNNIADSWAFEKTAKNIGIDPDGKGVPSDFTNYLVEGSPISGIPFLTKDHLGATETLKEGELRDFLDHYAENHPIKSALLEIMNSGLTLTALEGIDYVFYSHAMLGILEFMRQKETEDGINYYGTSKADTISANNSSNVIHGYDGNDTISGNGGNDTIRGGNGDDSIDGGSGNDTAVFSGNFAEYSISLDKNSLVFTVTGRDGIDQLTHVESFAFEDKTLNAGDACTVVNGSYRNEYLYGNDLDNHLYGYGGDDVLEAKKGNDTIDGGSGFDTVIFTGTYAQYVITQNADQTSFTIKDTVVGGDGTDLVIGVEQYRFACDDVRDAAHLIDGGGGGTVPGGGGITVSANRVSSSTRMFPGHNMGEWSNVGAYAALYEDGSLVTWGRSYWGGDSSAVASKLNGDVDVVQVFSAAYAFAALREDGSIVTWGKVDTGGDSNAVAEKLNGDVDVVQLFSTKDAFAALRQDGSVVTWGDSRYGGDSSAAAEKLNGDVDVVQIFSTSSAFAALREDGSVVTWGDSGSGVDSSAVASKLNGDVDVVQIFSSYSAFAALCEDGSVVTWGSSIVGGDSSAVASKLNGDVGVVQVFSTKDAFAALREDGSVVTWGDSRYGGDSSAVASNLNGDVDVTQVFSTYGAFAALRKDGSVVTWGDSFYGGNSSAVAEKLNGSVDMVKVFSTEISFAALCEDGSVVRWGSSFDGDYSSTVVSKLNGDVDVLQVFSTEVSFAALREDGSVVTWGWTGLGGDSSAVAEKLNGDVDVVQVFSTNGDFAALREDRSVVTWGSGDGGDSSAVADKLHDVVSISDIYSNGSQDRIFNGTDGNDNLTGSYASDILWGNGGNDTLAAMGGNDLVFGGTGNNLFIGGEGEGDDTYVGGEGVDTVKYTSALAGITVDLAEGAAYSTDGNDAAAIGTDVLIDIENVIASNFNDLLIGNAVANSLEGVAGDDLLRGGEGADTLDGGPGSDTADYSDKIADLSVTLNGAVDATVVVGGVAEDTIRNIENLIGGSGNDTFIGDSADNLFRGGAGNDTLDGGIGLDTADYSDKTEAVSVTLHGSLDAIVMVGGVAEDTIRNIENLIGGSGNDTFIGDAMANNLSGGAGNDTLQGGAGNDTLDGGSDADTIVFSGNLAEYSISYNFDNKTYAVTDSVSGRDGSDLVTGAEFFQFADGVHSVADLIDIVPPYLQSMTPAEYETNVAVGADMVFTFTEPVQAGTGSILLQTGGTTVMTIDVTDTAQVSFNGSTLTINPSGNFAFDSEYTVSIGAGSIADFAGNSWAGIKNITFTTAIASDTIAPTVATFSPADGTSGISIGSDIMLTFSETVVRGTGVIAIHSSSATGVVVESYNAANSTNISISDNVLTINPTADLAHGTQYVVTFDQGSVKDLAGNAYAGTTSYDFTTELASSSISFNTTGTVNGYLPGYGYEKFTAATGGVRATAPGWSLFLDTATDSDNNPYTFNALWNWNSGGSDTGILTFLDTDPYKTGVEEWSATFTATQISPLIADGADPDTLPDGFVTQDFKGNVLQVPLIWQAKDSQNVVARFSVPAKDGQNKTVTFSGLLKDTNNDTLPDRILGSLGATSFDYGMNLVDTNSDGKFDQLSLIFTTIRSGLVQADAAGHPAGIYLGNSTSGDVTAPIVTTFNPSDAATAVAVGSNIVLTFSEIISRGNGAIAIHSGSATGTVVESYDVVTSTNISVSGHTLTINPTSDLANGTHYFVTIDSGCVQDTSSNVYSGTDSYDFTTEAAPIASVYDISGSVTFWKTGTAIADVTSTLTSVPAATGTQPIEFRNIQIAADGTRTIEIWETSAKSDINSVQLAFALPTGSVATWQNAAVLPSSWSLVGNTDKPGEFILAGMGLTDLSSGSVKFGIMTLTAPTNPQHFDLVLSTGELGNDTLSAFRISSDSTITGIDGLYQFLDMAEGDYVLATARVAGAAESAAVKANDALAALKIAVGMNPNTDGSAISPYQYLAADVNHDGQIKAADALNILKMAVKLDTAPANEWLFVPESVGSESMTRNSVIWPDNPVPVTLDTDQELHLIGIVMGDVNGSWAA